MGAVLLLCCSVTVAAAAVAVAAADDDAAAIEERLRWRGGWGGDWSGADAPRLGGGRAADLADDSDLTDSTGTVLALARCLVLW